MKNNMKESIMDNRKLCLAHFGSLSAFLFVSVLLIDVARTV